MKLQHTNRGFALYEFTDTRKVPCSLQKSSIASEDRIWLGADELGLKAFYPGHTPPWVDVDVDALLPFADGVVDNCRMELNREQVSALLPILQKFVETGEIE